MCRLFGLLANRPVDIKFSMRPFRDLGQGNPDGWGLGWFNGNDAVVEKEPIPADTSATLPRLSRKQSKIWIGHVRRATLGDRTWANCHPFVFDNWLFAHNGSIDPKQVFARLEDKYADAVQGQTDSEVYFLWILQNIENYGSVVEGIAAAIGDLRNFKGLNFLLSNGSSLYAYRNASRDEQCYSLLYLRRGEGCDAPPCLSSQELSVLIECKRLHHEAAVLICSESLTGENWMEIPLGNLLVVDDDLSCRVKEIGSHK